MQAPAKTPAAQPQVIFTPAVVLPSRRGAVDPLHAAYVRKGPAVLFPEQDDFDKETDRYDVYYFKGTNGWHRLSLNMVRLAGMSQRQIVLDGCVIATKEGRSPAWVTFQHQYVSDLRTRLDYCEGRTLVTFTLDGHEVEIYGGLKYPLLQTMQQLFCVWKPTYTISVDGFQVLNGKLKPEWQPKTLLLLTILLFPFLLVLAYVWIFFLCCVGLLCIVKGPTVNRFEYDLGSGHEGGARVGDEKANLLQGQV